MFTLTSLRRSVPMFPLICTSNGAFLVVECGVALYLLMHCCSLESHSSCAGPCIADCCRRIPLIIAFTPRLVASILPFDCGRLLVLNTCFYNPATYCEIRP